jgi:hypothetical protein
VVGLGLLEGRLPVLADHDFNEQELELKTNTQITREIHTLTTELHNRLLPKPTRQQS